MNIVEVFEDGSEEQLSQFMELDTAAFDTGMRYCIDGAALIFEPAGGGGKESWVYGDTPLKAEKKPSEPGWLKPPEIKARGLSS